MARCILAQASKDYAAHCATEKRPDVLGRPGDARRCQEACHGVSKWIPIACYVLDACHKGCIWVSKKLKLLKFLWIEAPLPGIMLHLTTGFVDTSVTGISIYNWYNQCNPWLPTKNLIMWPSKWRDPDDPVYFTRFRLVHMVGIDGIDGIRWNHCGTFPPIQTADGLGSNWPI